MKKEDYMRIQMLMIKIGHEVEKCDFDGFLQQISRAETIGPMLDPTLYRKAQDNMEQVKKMAILLRQVQQVHLDLKTTIIKTAASHGQTTGIPGSSEEIDS